MDGKEIAVKLIKYQSLEYQQACELRYRLFYNEHGLSWNAVIDSSDANCFHAAIILQSNLVAYGQLSKCNQSNYQIKQMVVEPSYQKQGLGKQILLTLLNLAKQQGATEIALNARLSAVGFYQKIGFKTCGIQFPSSTTGVIHVPMKQKF